MLETVASHLKPTFHVTLFKVDLSTSISGGGGGGGGGAGRELTFILSVHLWEKLEHLIECFIKGIF